MQWARRKGTFGKKAPESGGEKTNLRLFASESKESFVYPPF